MLSKEVGVAKGGAYLVSHSLQPVRDPPWLIGCVTELFPNRHVSFTRLRTSGHTILLTPALRALIERR